MSEFNYPQIIETEGLEYRAGYIGGYLIEAWSNGAARVTRRADAKVVGLIAPDSDE